MRVSDLVPFRSIYQNTGNSGAGGLFELNDTTVPLGYYRVYVGIYASHSDAAREMELRVVRLGSGVTTTLTGSASQGGGANRTRLWHPDPVLLVEGENLRVQIQGMAAAQTVTFYTVYFELPSSYPVPFFA